MKSTSRPRGTPRRPLPQRRPRPRKQPPIIPKTSTGGSPPTSIELLQEAALTLKEERRGVSLPEIRRQMLKKYKGRFDKASNDLLTTTLERLAERGKVIYKQGYKYMFKAPKVAKHKHNRDDTKSENITTSGADTNSYVSATTSGGSTTEGTNGRSLDSRTSASSPSETGTRSTGSRSSKSSKSSKSCTKSTRDTKSTKNTKSTNSTNSTKSIRSVKRKEAQDEPQDQEKAPQDNAQSPEKVEEEEEEKSSATGDLSSSVAATGYTTSKGSQESSKRRR